jgi:hypothetical protein
MCLPFGPQFDFLGRGLGGSFQASLNCWSWARDLAA